MSGPGLASFENCPSNSCYLCASCGGLFCATCYAPSACDGDVGVKTIGSWFCDARNCVAAEVRYTRSRLPAEAWDAALTLALAWHERRRQESRHPGRDVTDDQLRQLRLLGLPGKHQLAALALDHQQPSWRRLRARDDCARFLV